MAFRDLRFLSRARVLLLVALLFAAVLGASRPGHAKDPVIPYPLPLRTLQGEPDVTGTIAASRERARRVVDFLACGDEVSFVSKLLGADIETAEGGISSHLMAKIVWLMRLDAVDSDDALRRVRCDTTTDYDVEAGVTEFLKDGPARLNERIVEALGRDCDGLLAGRMNSAAGTFVQLRFIVNGKCMRDQVNKALERMQHRTPFGTNGLPCLNSLTHFDTAKEGDGDMALKDVTRIFFLAENARRSGKEIVKAPAREHVRDKLLLARGPLGEPGYSILACGNTDNLSEGTPKDILDERAWLNETIDFLGDAASWFAHALAIFVLLGGGPALVAFIGEGAALPSAAIAAAIATDTVIISVSQFKIPETENHRLMIESSRFLKNELIIEEQKDHPNVGSLRNDNDGVKRWLLNYMGEIMRRDFAEYNARPYQRLSLLSLLNLSEFAADGDVRRGARMVLEFALAKFALASREGIRVAPYRRLVEAMNQNQDMLEFGGRGSDFPISLMLHYAGQSQRLPAFQSGFSESSAEKAITAGTARMLIYPASSAFAPDNAILELAANKKTPYEQRIHHAGVEIYTNRASYTLAAGGMITSPALSLEIGPIKTPPTFLTAKPNDSGTGVPTSLILAGTNHVNRVAFMRFDGVKEDVGDVEHDIHSDNFNFGKEGRTYDHNTCVFKGFACGINYNEAEVRNPGPDAAAQDLTGCFHPGPDGAAPGWGFLDSKACQATKIAPPFFIARFLLPCTNEDSGCERNGRFGLFEVVDAPNVGFDEFKSRVVADNPVVFPGKPTPFDAVNQNGNYRMFGGQKELLLFSVIANKADRRLTGVLSVNGEPTRQIPDWPLAEGDVLNAKGDGVVSFTNPNTRQTVIWDFSDAQHPKRRPE